MERKGGEEEKKREKRREGEVGTEEAGKHGLFSGAGVRKAECKTDFLGVLK